MYSKEPLIDPNYLQELKTILKMTGKRVWLTKIKNEHENFNAFISLYKAAFIVSQGGMVTENLSLKSKY